MTEGEDNGEIESVGQFLEEFYPHFAIMGIFGTIALFLNGSFSGGGSELIAQGGIFAVLAIFAYTAAWIGWRALAELLPDMHEADRPLSTELGYTLIILSTFTIAVTISNQIISSFSEVWNIAISVLALAFGIVLYARNFPTERYSSSESSASDTGFLALGLMAIFVITLDGQIFSILNRHASSHWLRETLSVVVLGAMHLTMSENILGLKYINEQINSFKLGLFKVNSLLKFWESPWPFHFSTLLSTVSFIILALGLVETSNLDYEISILGISWGIFLTYIFILIVSVVASSIWFEPMNEELREKTAMVGSILILTGSLAALMVILV